MLETQTLNLRVDAVAHVERGWKCTLAVPWSQYPVDVVVPPDHPLAAKLAPGTVWAWTLKRGNLRKGKDGSTPDGTKEYHYWWNFGELAVPQAAPDEPAPARPQAATDLRASSIERQVSAKNRTELAIACLEFAAEHCPPDTQPLAFARTVYQAFAAEAEVRPSNKPDEPPDSSVGF